MKVDPPVITCDHGKYTLLSLFHDEIHLGKLQRPHSDLTGIIVSKGNHPHMALIHVTEILYFTQFTIPFPLILSTSCETMDWEISNST